MYDSYTCKGKIDYAKIERMRRKTLKRWHTPISEGVEWNKKKQKTNIYKTLRREKQTKYNKTK